MRGGIILALVTLVFATGIEACKKTEQIKVDGNVPPDYHSVPTLKVENYVNRLFIDMLGREALDTERIDFVKQLKDSGLSFSVRVRLIKKLQWDSSYHIGDSSYRHAYAQRLYDLHKARFLEGASDDDIYQQIGNLGFAITISQLNGDSVGVFSAKAEQKRYQDVVNSRYRFLHQLISYNQLCAVMLNNGIYDNINMNSFNYVQATFDNTLSRTPTQDEFTRAYDIIDKNIPRELFGMWAANKNEYCTLMTSTPEFFETQIRYQYYVLLQRQPTTQEVINLYAKYAMDKRIENVQLAILKSDEYAQFTR